MCKKSISCHNMKLHDDCFKAIKQGYKTIEMRLYDEKRSLININDIIIFENNKTKEVIKCIVINLYRYKSFDDFYQYHDKVALGYKEDEEAMPSDMEMYYSKDNIKKYGVVGIEIKVVND